MGCKGGEKNGRHWLVREERDEEIEVELLYGRERGRIEERERKGEEDWSPFGRVEVRG